MVHKKSVRHPSVFIRGVGRPKKTTKRRERGFFGLGVEKTTWQRTEDWLSTRERKRRTVDPTSLVPCGDTVTSSILLLFHFGVSMGETRLGFYFHLFYLEPERPGQGLHLQCLLLHGPGVLYSTF